tara:strand:- start:197 stop:646 length:450 start_codon:yes stop_codon:yes gene_type:complete
MFEIPKILVQAEFHLFDQETINGRMFVTEDLVTAAGNPSIEDYLNHDSDLFFPFESDNGAYRLINKRLLTFIRTVQDDSEILSQTPLDPKSLVVYFANGLSLYGLVYRTQYEETRVSDIINANQDFISMHQNRKRLILNRHQIIYVNAK